MVCGAAVNYKWKQKGLSSAFLPDRDPDGLAWAGHVHETGGHAANLSVSLVLDY